MEWIQILLWSVALATSLFVLIKGADVFIDGAKQVGASLGMSSFVIGIFIVGFGTSLPELASSVAGVFGGAPEMVLGNVVGSNITNILLIVGLMAALGTGIVIKQDLLKTELPIFAIATIHFVMMVMDGVIDRIEALLLLGTFIAYLWYVRSSSQNSTDEEEVLDKPALKKIAILSIVGGILAVIAGAYYTVEMAVNIATALSVPIGIISIVAIAIGTSLPELFVSLRALKTGESEMAIGNIFGSNAFNILVVIGIPAMVTPLPADEIVMGLAVTVMVAASVMLFVIGLAKQVMRWEGVMMLLFFGFFLAKLTLFV